MMKRLSLLALVLAFGAFTAGAHAACPGNSNDLAWLLAPAEVAATQIAAVPEIDFASADRGGSGSYTKATCTASCAPYANVTCSYTPPSTCVAVDRNCAAGQRGYVTCNGATTYCPICPCPEGEYRWVVGGCCSGKLKSREQVCQGGVWKNTGVIECDGSCF